MAVKTIGTGGDYSTVQAWEDSLLATLLQDEEGQCKNQEFSDSGTIVDFSAHDTTLGTLTLTTESGASFKDNANVRTNGLRYNPSNGAALKTTGSYIPTLKSSGSVPRLIITKLQFWATYSGGSSGAIIFLNVGAGSILKDCICEYAGGYGGVTSFEKTINCIFICLNNSFGDGYFVQNTSSPLIENTTVVRVSNLGVAGTAFVRAYCTPKIVNCAAFGFSNATNGSFDGTSSNNATDLSSGLPGSSNHHSVTYSATTPFTQADSGSALDFRLANDANSLIDNGSKDATNAPNDISGTARASACEIGVWELASSGTAYTQNVSGAFTPSAAIQKAIAMPVAGTVATLAATLLAAISRALSASAGTPAATLIDQLSRRLSAGETPAGSESSLRTSYLSISGSETPSASVIKQTARSLTAAVSTLAATLILTLARSLAGAVTSAADISTVKSLGSFLSGSIATAGSLVKQTAMSLLAAMTPAATAIKQISRSLAGTATSSSTVATIRVTLASLSGSLNAAGSVLAAIARTLTASIASSSESLRTVFRSLAASIASAGQRTASTPHALTAMQNLSATISKTVFVSNAGILASAGTIVRGIVRIFQALLHPSATIRLSGIGDDISNKKERIANYLFPGLISRQAKDTRIVRGTKKLD